MLMYIVFVFPYVRSYVRSCVRYISLFLLSSVTLVEFTSKFWLKFLQWCMSHLKFYLDQSYPGGLAVTSCWANLKSTTKFCLKFLMWCIFK